MAEGNRIADIASVIFAKPEQKLEKTRSIITEKKVNAHKPLVNELCTIIFTSAQALQQFIQQFRHGEAWKTYSNMQIGFTEKLK